MMQQTQHAVVLERAVPAQRASRLWEYRCLDCRSKRTRRPTEAAETEDFYCRYCSRVTEQVRVRPVANPYA